MEGLSERKAAIVFPVAIVVSIAVLAGIGLLAEARDAPRGGSNGTAPTPRPTHPPVVLVGAGDIADCGEDGDRATAALLATIDGIVFTTGDNAYPDGAVDDYAECYEPTWGAVRSRTRPVPGNHEYDTGTADAYRAYFGAQAVPLGTTWYSFTAGAWLVLMLDSECDEVGGCGPDSPQVRWLRDELAGSDRTCQMAVWHRPRFSSGYHGGDNDTATFWEVLHEAGADIVVNGHDHDYERFAPQDATGTADPESGIREFVAGTGGANLRPFEAVVDNSEVRDDTSHGVLRLTLADGSYDWTFVPVADATFTDAGSGTCHGAPTSASP
jgi:hypothetical protein